MRLEITYRGAEFSNATSGNIEVFQSQLAEYLYFRRNMFYIDRALALDEITELFMFAFDDDGWAILSDSGKVVKILLLSKDPSEVMRVWRMETDMADIYREATQQ